METTKGIANGNTKTRVGFIGLGLMGKGMARNLARAGFPLSVYNRTRSKADELSAETGCAVVDSPSAAAQTSDVVITMVSDVPDVEEVYLGDSGIIKGSHDGLVAVDMSTVGPACVRRVSAALEAKGVAFVDAPVSGGSWGAEQGTLSIMAGGSDAALKTCRPVFEAMGKTIVYCGPVGAGQTTKLANQIVGALNLEAVCEAVLYARKAGADLAKVIEAVGGGASASWSWQNLAPRIVGGDYAPGFKVEHMIKDLRLALEAAEEMGVRLPGVTLVLQNLRRVQAAGGGEQGTQALIQALES